MICGSLKEAATTTVSSTVSTTTFTSTQLSHASTPTEPSVVNTIENTNATLSSSTINVSYDSLSKESTKDDPEMLCKYLDAMIQCFPEIFQGFSLFFVAAEILNVFIHEMKLHVSS